MPPFHLVTIRGGAGEDDRRTHRSPNRSVVVRSASATAESYAPADDPTVTRSGEIERRDWGSVRLVTQFGTGHVIPNRKAKPFPFIVGPSHQDLDLGEEIQEFFGL